MTDDMDILLWDDPALTAVCRPVEENEFGPALAAFGEGLVRAMCGARGLGLAAPQVGVGSRVFAMAFPEDEARAPIVVCNPALVLSTATPARAREGCLSLPDIFEEVARAPEATMQYRDPLGGWHEAALVGFDARVAQHEADHLDGVMFFQRMSRQLRRRVLAQWDARGA